MEMQARELEEQAALIGMQQIFYFSGKRTVDGKGSRYHLLSFNVQREKGYVHYRRVGSKNPLPTLSIRALQKNLPLTL